MEVLVLDSLRQNIKEVALRIVGKYEWHTWEVTENSNKATEKLPENKEGRQKTKKGW